MYISKTTLTLPFSLPLRAPFRLQAPLFEVKADAGIVELNNQLAKRSFVYPQQMQ